MATGVITKVTAVGLILDSETTLYTVPTGLQLIHVDATFCNTHASTDDAFDLHYVPSGGSRGASNQIVKGLTGVSSLRAGDTGFLSNDPMLAAGDTIRAIAATTNLIAYRLGLVLEEL
jgi:hypothetical protein